MECGLDARMFSSYLARSAAAVVFATGLAATMSSVRGASNDVTISNGGLSVTFNLAWGAAVVGIANQNVDNGLDIVDAHDVGRLLQEDQFLYQEIAGSQQLMINPVQAGASGGYPYYQHPNGSSFPEIGSPVVSWTASANQFQAVIVPLDYNAGTPTAWVYVENVSVTPKGVANFSYTCYSHQAEAYLMGTEVPTLYTDRTDAFMYPTSTGGTYTVTGSPVWPQPGITSNGWIANVDTTDNIGIFYTTPVGLPEVFGTFPGAAVLGSGSAQLPLGKTKVAPVLTAQPGEVFSNKFSVLVSTPQVGPSLISRQAPATFTTSASIIGNGVFSANAGAYIASPGYSSLGGNPVAPTAWAASGNSGINGPDTGFYGSSNEPFAPSSTASVSDFNFIQWRGAYTAQTAATVAGQPYTLAFDAAARSGDSSAVLEVLITSPTNGRQIISLTPAITDTAFTPFLLNFTAMSGTTNIEFLNNSPQGVDDTVDVSNVSLVAVPEPATVVPLVIGALAAMVLGPRRRARCALGRKEGRAAPFSALLAVRSVWRRKQVGCSVKEILYG